MSSPQPKGTRGPGNSRISPRIQALKEAKKAAMAKNKGKKSSDFALKDPFQNAIDAKDMTRGSTGFVYSPEMLKHCNPWDPDHIESPERLRRSVERCQELQLLQKCLEIPSRMASDEEICLVHTQKHIDILKGMKGKAMEELKYLCMRRYHSVYINQDSLECARFAVGAAIDLTNAVVEGKVQNGMALVRPPGHHAMEEEYCGFCLFNSVAIAAKNALKREEVEKILIVDFDVHHGQATQHEFYDNPNVLYISIHRYEHGEFWPHLRQSDFDYNGTEKGAGFNVNVPLNKVGMEDKDYLAIFHQLIMPMAYEYSPDLVLVSAGYDAALGCPEGEMRLSPQIYGHIINNLMALAKGKVAAILEGGYFIESVAEGVALTLRALLGYHSFSVGILKEPSEGISNSIANCLSALRSNWHFLQLQEEYSIAEYDALKSQNCHEPIIIFKGTNLAEERNLNMVAYEPGNFYLIHSDETKKQFKEELVKIRLTYESQLAKEKNFPVAQQKVALVYDDTMMKHKNVEEPTHPESPQRIKMMMSKIEEYGLLPRLLRIDPRKATEEEICLVHDKEHFNDMAAIPTITQPKLNDLADKYDSIFFNPNSFDCALLSCGSLLNIVDCVCNGDAEKGVAVIRPPGHHAEMDEACGFCLFNNVAVAAKYALESHDLKRILILDWDVHHGNGIQNMFYDDPRVLYISLHRFDHGTFFPGREDANFNFVGSKAGEGFNVNIPWNGAGMGDAEYISALFHVILPIAYQYCPDLVLVSAGFDAARGDPLGHCRVSPETYGHFIQHLQNLANGKIIVALEGGYNLNSISLSMTMCIKALLGDPLPNLHLNKKIKQNAIETLRDVMYVQSNYWSCLKSFNKKLPNNFADLMAHQEKKGEKLTLEEKLATNAYIPQEYGSHAQASLVNTLSQSGKIESTNNVTVDSKKKAAILNEVEDCDGLKNLSLTSTTCETSFSSDYVPFEYGPSFGTSCINTISNAAVRSQCEIKNTLEKTIMETDENKSKSSE